MGRIRTDEIKNITGLLISKYSLSYFSDDFNKNKELLNSLPEELPSKKVRNKVAGHLVFLTKKHREEEQKLLEPTKESEVKAN